jgi:hypothetical protein
MDKALKDKKNNYFESNLTVEFHFHISMAHSANSYKKEVKTVKDAANFFHDMSVMSTVEEDAEKDLLIPEEAKELFNEILDDWDRESSDDEMIKLTKGDREEEE